MRKYMDFQEIYEVLGRACTDSEIQEICEYISYDPCDIIFLLQTPRRKNLWRNEARVIVRLDNAILERYLNNLLDWLFDLNWPGAELIYDRIVRLPHTPNVDRTIEDTFAFAQKCFAKNRQYICWINVLKDLRKDRQKAAGETVETGPVS